MATTIPKVISNISGGKGRPLAGEDHITGLLCYDDPTDYPSGIMKKWVTATAYLDGDILEDDTNQKLYTVQGDYTSGATVAADVGTADLIEITSLQELREARIVQVYASTMESLGFVEGGISDDLWYMLNAYFAKNPDGYLWFGCYSTSIGTVTFTELADFGLVAGGKIKYVGIYNNGNDAAMVLADLANIQIQTDALAVADTPLSVTYCPLTYAEVHGSFLDLRSNGNNDGVTVFNSFDQVANSAAKPALGTFLGFLAISKVSESIGNVEQYNFVQGSDLENTYILDSSGLVKYGDLSLAQLNTLVVKGFSFLYKLTNYFGTYLNGNQVCVAASYSFQRQEQLATMNKARRNIRTFCLPLLNSEIVFNEDGTMTSDTIAKFQNAAERALDPMAAATEIGPDPSIDIDSSQNVQSDDNVNITATIVLNGVSTTITVNLASAN